MVRPLRAQISKMWASARRKAKMWASARRIHKGREALNAQAFSRALKIARISTDPVGTLLCSRFRDCVGDLQAKMQFVIERANI